MKTSGIIFLTLVTICLYSCRKDSIITPSTEDNRVPYLMDTSSKWMYTDFWGDGGLPNETYYIDSLELYFEGDTIMSRKTIIDFNNETSEFEEHNYFILKRFKRSYYYNWPWGLAFTESGTHAYVRVDSNNRRIYVAHGPGSIFSWLGEEKEVVLYDFNVKENDTLPYNSWDYNNSEFYIAKNVGFLQLNNHELVVYSIQDDNGDQKSTFIEGIGSVNGFAGDYNFYGDFVYFQNKDFYYSP